MPITFKMNVQLMSVLEKLDIPGHMIEWLAESTTATGKITAEKISFFTRDADDHNKLHLVAEVPVTLDNVHKLMAGKLLTGAKVPLKAQVSEALLALKDAVETSDKFAPASTQDQPAPPAPAVSTLSKLPPLAVPAANTTPEPVVAPEPVVTGGFSLFNPALMTSAPVVKLRDATKLYQPVSGSSTGSRYFVVGCGKNARVAARYTDKSLSIRVEGPLLETGAASDSMSQMGMKVSKAYASIHLNVENDNLAAKTLGAVMMGLGIKLETPLPDLMLLKGKGC